ncbi:hypothetical protein [Pseudomonas fluorescens]|uniref:hypothetical protein n=1 Tax=Pseudomonas fluorescens TaxID=294 RepID=UPI00123FB03D|nr:hypothetical protein [Pseudomonas fluorescens]
MVLFRYRQNIKCKPHKKQQSRIEKTGGVEKRGLKKGAGKTKKGTKKGADLFYKEMICFLEGTENKSAPFFYLAQTRSRAA